MGYECIVCMETLDTPAPTAAVAVPQYFQDIDKPGSSRQQRAKRSAEDTPEYRSNICSTACGHIFHRACLNRWFYQKMKSECPSCRKLLTPAKVCHIYPPSLSEDFLSHKVSELREIEDHLPRCRCRSEECVLLYEIHKTLANDHSKLLGLLQRFTDSADDKSLLLARIASLEQEVERLKGVPASEGPGVSNEDTQPTSSYAHSFSTIFERDFTNLFPPSSSSSSSPATSDSETSPALYNSILSAFMTPTQLSRLCGNELRNALAHAQPILIRPGSSSGSTSSLLNAARNMEYVVSSSAQRISNDNERPFASVTRAVIATVPERAVHCPRDSTIHSNVPSSSTSARNISSSTQGTSNPVPTSSTTSQSAMFSRKPRVSINLLSYSDATDIRNSLAAHLPQSISHLFENSSENSNSRSTSRPPRQLAIKSTGRPPRDISSFRCPPLNKTSGNSKNSGQQRNNNLAGPQSLKSLKVRMISKKSTAKPPRSAPSRSRAVASSSRITCPMEDQASVSCSTSGRPIKITKSSIARKSTSKPPRCDSNRVKRQTLYYSNPYYYTTSESAEEEEIPRRSKY